MAKRWRDQKGEPGFIFLAWMKTVDDLEDQIAELVATLREARVYAEQGFAYKTLARIDAALTKAEVGP